MDKHFPGEERESLVELGKDVSLVLYTGHPLLDGVQPVVPNFKYVGLMHCRQAQPLPQDFEDFMQSSGNNGVILLSFGTFAKDAYFPEAVRLMLLKVFAKLEQKVIFKWDGEHMEDLPSNVMLSKWIPQQDILGHPATKLFISHVGQSSLQEALYHEVPLVLKHHHNILL